jgi:hypothetical protein
MLYLKRCWDFPQFGLVSSASKVHYRGSRLSTREPVRGAAHAELHFAWQRFVGRGDKMGHLIVGYLV